MTWTASTFKARYPEFATADDALVTAVIADAANLVDPALSPIDSDFGVGLKAAHILAISLSGQAARLTAKDGSTTYGTQFDEWVRDRAGGPWIAGQMP